MSADWIALLAGTPFAEMATLLVLAAAVGFVGLQLRQPLIVAFIAVGLLAGPAALGIARSQDQIDLLAQLGIAVLLFLVGTKLDVKLIRSLGVVAVTTGLGQVLFTSAFGFLIGLGLGMGWVESLYVAVALTFSSTIIIVKLLSDKREIDSLHGQVALGFLIVQDLVVVFSMVALSTLGFGAEAGGEAAAGPDWTPLLRTAGLAVALLALVILFVRYVADPLTERVAKAPELLITFAIGLAAMMAAAADAIGLGKEIGGLLAGVAVASTPYRDTIAARLSPLRDFLLLFFFISLGSHLDLTLIGDEIAAAAVFSAFVLIGNPLIVLAIMGAMGYRKRTGFLAGLTVAQISEFSLIFVAMGVALGHVGPDALGLVTLVGIITIAVSTYMITWSHELYALFAPLLGVFERRGTPREAEAHSAVRAGGYDAVVFGHGRFGDAIAARLRDAGWRTLCVDFNPAELRRARAAGFDALFGDASDPAFVSQLPLAGVRWVVAAMPAHALGVTHDDPRRALVEALAAAGYRGSTAVVARHAADRASLLAARVDAVLDPFEDAADRAAEIMLAQPAPEPAAAAVETGADGAWHARAAEEAVVALGSAPGGLDAAEAASRLARIGPNRLAEPARRGSLRRFLAQFESLLIQVLLAAAVVTALLDHWVDTAVIAAVAVVNAAIGFLQEGKAERALQAIRAMLSPRATVLRDGARETVDAETLVPGDVVLLEPGDRVPADLRITRARGLRVQEASLTGESVPVDKGEAPVAAGAPLGDRASMAFASTLVAAGQGAGVVVRTGPAMEIGRISGMLGAVEETTTPLLRKMNGFARVLTLAILALAALVFAFGAGVRGLPVDEMFMVVVGLAVAAIPEGLPAILTVTLAIGVQRMAARRAILRRLPAVETLGSVSVICSDKTGTLTRNEMTVRGVATVEGVFTVGGEGYAPRGGFSRDGAEKRPEAHPLLMEAARAAALCNDARLVEAEGGWRVTGDPMEGALLTLAAKAGLDAQALARETPRADEIPFDSAHRFMATLHRDHGGAGAIYLKGAPERVLELCAAQRGPDGDAPLDPGFWRAQVEAMAGEGQRVLAVAAKPAEQASLSFEDAERGGFTLLGLLGLIDPPRAEAIEAVADCRAAGVRVKMITGDHGGTARAIAARLGLENPRDVLTGADIAALDDAALADRVAVVDVFARTSPEDKLRLVRALRARGQIIAMTGDGVNDAPALKQADVGVAMGRGGTEAAKEASEMVLADDDFASIAAAMREGRTVYDNLKKAIVFLLPVNGGESFAIIFAILLGLTLPITPLQILWVNMVSSVGLAMALAFEPSEADVMRRPPRPADEPILSGFLLWRVAFVSTLFFCGIFGIFWWTQQEGATLAESRTYAVNTLVVMEIFYLFSVRRLRTPALTLSGVKGTRPVLIALGVVVALQLIFTYAPFMEAFFDTRPVDFVHGAEILGIGVALFAILEVEKRLIAAAAGWGGGKAKAR